MLFLIYRVFIFIAMITLGACATVSDAPPPVVEGDAPAQSSPAKVPVKNPHHIALLVPLQGNLGSSGKAVQSGFLAAHAANSEVSQIEVINIAQEKDIQAAYQQAISKGADFIVGPLAKSDVKNLTSNANLLHVPTLTLNYLNPSDSAPANIYQFGLSPFDEARQAVALAKQAGNHNAIIIAPRGEWGKSVADVFQHEWLALGGEVKASLLYTNSNKAMADQIKHLLQFKQTAGRHSTGTSRHDFDVVFLAAPMANARLIKPLLKFYNAGDVPVYATSLVYSGLPNPRLDEDLDGITFCDAPWVLQDKHMEKNARLFALGKDAYLIAAELYKLTGSQDTVQGTTGKLYLNDEHRIVRELVCAQFKNGVPEVLNNTTPASHDT